MRDLRGLGQEIRKLEKRGFVAADANIAGGYRIGPEVFLWWLVEEIVRTVRRDVALDEWLEQQELDGHLTRGQRTQLTSTLGKMSNTFEQGVTTLIEATVKGVVGSMSTS